MTNDITKSSSKKEDRKAALSLASREYYRRMKILGYKKYGVLIKEEQMIKLGLLAEQVNTTKFELLESILAAYLKDLDKAIEKASVNK